MCHSAYSTQFFFNISDHLSPLIRREYIGSKAAENFSCGRTKTAAISDSLIILANSHENIIKIVIM